MPVMMKTALTFLAVASTALALQGAASAQSVGSLQDARKAVREGTTPGITIIPARKRAEPPPAQASAPQAAGSAAGPAAAGASAPAVVKTKSASGSVAGEILRSLPPPSGTPINSARRLDSPQLGIPIPGAASAPR
jgi:hypothetical protein